MKTIKRGYVIIKMKKQKKHKMEMIGTGIATFIILGLTLMAISISHLVDGKLKIFSWAVLIIGNCFLGTGLYHLYLRREAVKEKFEEIFL